MAKYVIPPKGKQIIIKCNSCGALYVPEKMRPDSAVFVEPCPCCGETLNSIRSNSIPLWKYNLIKLWRGGFRSEDHQTFL